MSQPSPTSIAAMAGILGSSWVAGGIASISLLTMPSLLTSNLPPGILAKQWAAIFNKGKVVMPGVALLSLAAFAYASYNSRQYGNRWRQYAIAGALTIALVPFTVGFMGATNGKLLGVAAAGVGGDQDALELVRKWSGLNLARSLLPLLGAGVGIWGLVGW